MSMNILGSPIFIVRQNKEGELVAEIATAVPDPPLHETGEVCSEEYARFRMEHEAARYSQGRLTAPYGHWAEVLSAIEKCKDSDIQAHTYSVSITDVTLLFRLVASSREMAEQRVRTDFDSLAHDIVFSEYTEIEATAQKED
ncbi:MAG: hypothetical protein KAS32_00640 [Candidatus Peribacteraceae bacterium]|nr:hypothetical protein [Candidatus Peribacteraceae bacterium]